MSRGITVHIIDGKKLCTKCKEWLLLEDFGKTTRTKSGRKSACNECHRKEQKRFYRSNKEKVQARVAKWVEKNPERLRELYKQNKAKNRERDRERNAARSECKRAIFRGDIDVMPCVYCGSVDVQPHHHNYKEPLNVTFMCPEHHRGWHRVFEAEY